MALLLRKLVVMSGVCLVVMSTIAEANWSISNNTDTKNSQARSHVLQIFASANPTKAEGMKNTLEIQGYPAFIRVQAKLKQHYYQVQIGPFGSKKLARNAKTSLVQLYPEYPFFNEAILKVSYR